MKTLKKIKKAYERLPVPDKEDVLPEEAKTEPVKARRFSPRLAYSLASLVLVASIVTALAVGVFRGKPTDPVADTPKEYSDGVIGEKPKESFDKDAIGMLPGASFFYKGDGSGYSEAARDGEIIMEDGGEYELPTDAYEGVPNAVDPRAGLLTASEWRDGEHLAEWFERISDEEWASVIRARSLLSAGVVAVNVKSGDAAIYNVTVTLESGDYTWTAKTGVSGRAYLFYPESLEGSAAVIKAAGAEQEVTLSQNGGQFTEASFDVDAAYSGAEALDLMLMVDTTGSMGDELEYLKEELSNMVSRISFSGELSIRVSVNFYRDEGDEYVVKYFDFRENIDECIEQIRAQRSDGGGDYPEAVHTALENAVTGHEWREDAVKLCFFVLDAPPHNEQEVPGINENIMTSIETAAAEGIRIIPVASSGVDTETEVILRSFALMTGGTYIYLTNDSGIGGDHLEATVSEKNVEPLNECMIRVVCEYCGLTYEKAAANQNGQNQQNQQNQNYQQ